MLIWKLNVSFTEVAPVIKESEDVVRDLIWLEAWTGWEKWRSTRRA